MSNLKIFENKELGKIRVLEKDGEPWFVGKDVAEALGYSNTRDALITHVDTEDKDTVAIHDGTPGNPNQVIINESGLYSLIFSSKLALAKQFKRWVTSEVLPSIRKTGTYSIKPQRSSYGDLSSLMKVWLQWAKAMDMPRYQAMKMLIKFLRDKGEPFPEEMAYIPPYIQEQLPMQINIFNMNK